MRRVLGWFAGGLLLLPLHAGRAAPRLRAETSYLPMLSHMAEMHMGTGSRESGVCPPELVLTQTRLGDPLLPRPASYSPSPLGPDGGSLEMKLTPLHSRWGRFQVSVFNLALAYETSGEGSGTALQVGVLEVGFSF